MVKIGFMWMIIVASALCVLGIAHDFSMALNYATIGTACVAVGAGMMELFDDNMVSIFLGFGLVGIFAVYAVASATGAVAVNTEEPLQNPGVIVLLSKIGRLM